MYQDLSTRHDWTLKKAIVHLPISLKGNSKRISDNSLSPLGAQNKDLGSASPPIRDVTNRGHMTSATRQTTVRDAKVFKSQDWGKSVRQWICTFK